MDLCLLLSCMFPGDSDIELARLETDDTDGVVPGGLLSTTQESFSEHAWDPYQVGGTHW